MSKQYSLEQALRGLGKDINKLTEDIAKEAKQQVQVLAAQAHSMIVQKAQTRLRSTRTQYIDALSIEKISSSEDNEIWAVTLNKSAGWIEDGQKAHNMIDALVNGPKAKVSKEGHKYNVIPFKQNKPSSEMSLAQNKLANYVKQQLKDRGLDKTITQNGKPILGRAATVNLGSGPVTPKPQWRSPLLSGITVYQREEKTANGKSRIKRDVMTFRVVSEKQKGSGLWDHPGRAAANFFEETSKELDVIWEQMVKDIVAKAR